MAVTDIFELFKEDDKSVVFLRKDYSHVKFEECKKGGFTFKINKDGKSVYAHSKYDPVKEAKKFVDSMEIKRDSVFLIFGFGMGHFVRELMSRCCNRNFIFVYEPDSAVFSKIIDEGYCNDIFSDPNVYVISDSDIKSYDLFIKNFVDTDLYMRSQTYIIPTYEAVYQKEYLEFLKCTKEMVSENIIRKNTVFNKNENWVKNFYRNIKQVVTAYSLTQFENVFQGGTAVIVSAGPSLKKNMHLLKEIKGKVPIISVFVAAKVLLANDIVPDFIVSIDDIQKGMEEKKYDNIPLVFDSRVPPEFINAHKGIHININSNTDENSKCIYGRLGKKYMHTVGGGSVACDCTAMAQVFGCKNIILIGQDLAYTDNQCHVSGTDHEQKTADEIDREKFYVPAINGGEVLTDSIFKYYIEWFVAFAGTRNGIVKVIDATEGGALINNTEILTFREAIDKYCNIDLKVSETLSKIYEQGAIFSKEEQKKIFEDIDKEFENIDEIIDLIDEENELFDKYIKSLRHRSASNVKSIIKMEHRLDDYDEKLEKLQEKIKILLGISSYIKYANRILSAVKKIYDDDIIIESGMRRKSWNLELRAALESVKKLKEEYPNG